MNANSTLGDELTRGELQALIDWHDTQESEADAMDFVECIPHHRKRRAEFQALLDTFEERCRPSSQDSGSDEHG